MLGVLGLVITLSLSPTKVNGTVKARVWPEDTTKKVTDTAVIDSTQHQWLPDSLISSSALEQKVDYQAKDSVVFQLKKQRATLYNKSKVNYKKLQLKSGKIKLNWATNLVQARGLQDSGKLKQKPVFKESDQEFRTDSMDYNFTSKKGKLYNLRTQQGQGYLHGEEVKKNEYDVAYASEAKYTTCDKADPHFHLSAKKIKTIPNDKIVTGPANLVVGGVPLPLFLPFGFFPNTQERSSGLIFPSYGEDNRRGFFLKDLGYYTGINEHMDLKLVGSIFSKGSWNAKIESNYKVRYKYNGSVLLSYGRNVFGAESDPDFRESRSFAINWQHNQSQSAHPYRNFSADVNISSLTERRNRLTGTNDRLSNNLQSSIRYTHTLPRSPFSQLTLSMDQNQNLSTGSFNVTLPNGNLSSRRLKPFGSADAGILKNMGLNYDLKFRNRLQTNDSVLFEQGTWSDWRTGFQQNANLETSFNLLTYLSVSPSIDYNESFFFEKETRRYDHAQDTLVRNFQQGLYSARSYGVSANLSTNVYGTYNVNQFDIVAIRHAITPSVNFNYRPDFSDRRFNNYNTFYDRNGQRERYFQYRGPFGGVSSGAQGNMGINIKNNLEMKVRKGTDTGQTLEKVTLIDQFNITTDYNFLADSFQLSPVRLSANTKLFDAVNIRFNATLDPYFLNPADTTREKQFALAEKGSLGRITNYNLNLSANLNPKTFNGQSDDNPAVGLRSYRSSRYQDFDVPWNFNVSYNLNYSNRRLEQKVTRNFMSVGGDLELTDNWKIGSQLNYSIKQNEFQPTTVRVNRDLHCWEMSFEWTPFSDRSFYLFSINPKSSVLRDLEYEQRQQR